jgi:hypothetical protein
MVALDEIERNAAQAHLKRLEGLVEDIRKALVGPSNASEKVAWLKELLAVQGYRVDGHYARQREPAGLFFHTHDGQ